MFISRIAPSVSARTRAKGSVYFTSGRVVEINGAEWVANATVRGSRDYRVDLVRDRQRFTAACECPYYADRADICKHIWAALLEAEERGLLAGDGPAGEEATLEPEYRPSGADLQVEPAPSYSPPGSRAPVVKPPPWQRFLHELRQDVLAGEGAAPLPRFSNGEIIYAINVRDTLAGRGTVVTILFRQRRKNGAWTKPRSITVSPAEAEHLVEAHDREILSLLLGASNGAGQGMPYDGGYSRLSRYVLNGPLEDRVLPMLARTGRAQLDVAGDGRTLLPIAWDGGEPWRFELDITAEPADDTLMLDGAFVRGAERMALKEPLLLLSRGFLFTRETMARLELEGGFAWVARLRAFGRTAIPRAEAGVLLETLARSGVNPGMLPEELRYDVVDGTPRPRIRVGRPERQNPYALRQDLRAAVQFDYDGIVVEAPPGATAYDSERRRLVRRNRAAEQAAIDRLHQLGFRYTWSHFESRQMLGISPSSFPRSCTRWSARAGGSRRRGAPSDRRSACSSRSRRGSTGSICRGISISGTDARRRFRSCWRQSRAARMSSSWTTAASGCCRRSGCGGMPRLPGSARPRAMRSASGARRRRCSTRCSPPSRRLPTTRCSRGRERSCGRSAASRRPTRRRPSAGRCATTSARRSAGSSSCGASASAAASPTTWASARP